MQTPKEKLKEVSQRLIELASGNKTFFKVKDVSNFDYSIVISSEPFNLKVDEKGELVEQVLYLRITNTDNVISFLSLYQMPLKKLEKYQDALRVPNENYFERTIHNLPIVIEELENIGFLFSNKERYI